MISRIIYKALSDGLEAIASDPTILDDIFSANLELEDEEVAKIKDLFVLHPPYVEHGYPMTDQKFPMYNIVLGSEQEKQHVLGDAGYDLTEGDDKGVELSTSIIDELYWIYVLSEHPTATIYYYETAKYILMQNQEITEKTIHAHFKGNDVKPDPEFIPKNLFVRQLTLDVGYEFIRLNRGAKLNKAWQLGGLHIDKNGSPSDVEDVNTNITTYTVEED